MSSVSTRARAGLPGRSQAAQSHLVFAVLMVGLPTLGAIAAGVDAALNGVNAMELVLFVAMFTLTTIGLEGGFHRYFCHRCAVATPVLTYALGALGSMASQGPVVFWTAIHLAHHQFSDRPGDPHSPQVTSRSLSARLRALLHSHVGWLFRTEQVDWRKYAPHLLKRRDVMLINKHYFSFVLLGLLLPAFIGGAWTQSWLGAWRGLLWGGLLRIFALHHLTWAVNSIGHSIGSTPFATGDNSRNLAVLALPTLGGSWHNNHHAFPAMARNDHHWWQIDPIGYVFEACAALGWMSALRRPPRFRRRDTEGARSP